MVNTALSCNFPLKSIHRIYCNYRYSSTINPIVNLYTSPFPFDRFVTVCSNRRRLDMQNRHCATLCCYSKSFFFSSLDPLSTTFPWHGGGQNANPLPSPRYGRAVLRGNLSGIEQNHYKAITKSLFVDDCGEL